jgi:tRNA dimethylallyltransferase
VSKILVIVGPTAVGKTALAIHLAEHFRGEIISGDSMQIYRGMDIGTAKATPTEQQRIPHHLLDLCTPDEAFSMATYQQLARQKIAEIQQRGHLPIIAGGTGLYIEAATYDYRVPPVGENRALRESLQQLAERQGKRALHAQLQVVDATAAARIHPNNVKRVIRALEVYELTGQRFSSFTQQHQPIYDPMLWIGLTMPREQLYMRINRRVDQMMAQGLLEEVRALQAQGFHAAIPAMQALGYKELLHHLAGEISLDEAVEQIKRGSRKYAKRQYSWFHRQAHIHWYDVTKDDISKEIQQFVAGKFILDRE